MSNEIPIFEDLKIGKKTYRVCSMNYAEMQKAEKVEEKVEKHYTNILIANKQVNK